MLDDLVAHINYFTYMLVAFSTGTLSQRCKGALVIVKTMLALHLAYLPNFFPFEPKY